MISGPTISLVFPAPGESFLAATLAAIMDLFLAEKVAVLESETTHKTCRSCGERLKLIRTMVNSRTGSILHMFECRCGERTWDD